MSHSGQFESAQAEPTAPSTGWRRWLRTCSPLLIAAVYAAVGDWSLRFGVVADGASLIWVPSGLALAAALLMGPRALPGVLLGAFIVNGFATQHGSLSIAAAVSLGNTLEAALGWWLLRRLMGFSPLIDRASDAVALAFVAAPLSPLPSALTGALTLCVSGTTPWNHFWPTLTTWYVGDGISILLLTPLVLGWAAAPRINWQHAIEGAVVGLLVALTAVVAFGSESDLGGAQYPLAFLPMPLIAWGAMRFGPRGAASLSFLLCVISAWATIQGRGPFDTTDLHNSIRLLWAFMAVVSGTALCLSATSAENRNSVNAIRESRERYRLLLDGSGVIAWEFDPSRMQFTYVSARAEALLGYPLREWYLPHFWTRVLHTDDREMASTFCAHQTSRGLDHVLDYRMVAADGRTVWIHDIVSVVKRSGGAPQLRGVMLDITDRKNAQEQLALAEHKFRTLFEQSPYGVWVADPQTSVIIDANSAVCDLLGRRSDEVIGRPIAEFEAGGSVQDVREHIERIVRQGGDVFETRMRRKDGSTFDAQFGVRSACVGGRAVLNAIIRDITVQKRAVASIRASEERFRGMFERHNSIMLLIDEETGAIIDANAAAVAFYGYSQERLRAMRIGDINQSPREDVQKAMAEAKRGRRNFFEFQHRLADGSSRVVEVHSSPLDYAGRTLLFSIIHDVTDRKHAQEERDRLQSQVLHAQKLESLGVLAGGIAHDFNNLLVGILGNTGIAMQSIARDSAASPVLRTVEQAAQRAAELTRQLLAYAGKGRFSIEPLCLSDLVMEMAQLLDVSIARTAEVTFDLDPAPPRIDGDATQIRQVVMNLLTNASDALHGKPGTIRIRTGTMHADAEYLAGTYVPAQESEGLYAFLEVSDSGCGMDEETLRRIFDPFFTTKFTGRGLGLAAALGIIRGHRGAIKVVSAPGAGTTVRMLLPVQPAANPPPNIAETKPVRSVLDDARVGGRVLVVDDEKVVRDMIDASLRNAGYTTLIAADGEAAIESLREHNGSVGAIVLDMTMPGLSGPAVMHKMREMGLSTPVILSSGYAEQDVLDSLGDAVPAAFLQKPYTHDELVRLVARIVRTTHAKA